MAQLTYQQREAIENEILAGRKIAAIKLHREATGTGLAEAKKAVEHLEVDLRRRCPERFVGGAQKSGCLGVLAVMAVLAAGGVWFAVHVWSS